MELRKSPGWERLVKAFRQVKQNFSLTALTPGSTMDQLVAQNAAAAQATAFEYSRTLPDLLLEDIEIQLKELRSRLIAESEDTDYEEDFRAGL